VAMSGSNNGLPNDKNDRSRNKGSIGDPKDIAWR
jgi:E3 ubiquitin-protein ligase HOS1